MSIQHVHEWRDERYARRKLKCTERGTSCSHANCVDERFAKRQFGGKV